MLRERSGHANRQRVDSFPGEDLRPAALGQAGNFLVEIQRRWEVGRQKLVYLSAIARRRRLEPFCGRSRRQDANCATHDIDRYYSHADASDKRRVPDFALVVAVPAGTTRKSNCPSCTTAPAADRGGILDAAARRGRDFAATDLVRQAFPGRTLPLEGRLHRQLARHGRRCLTPELLERSFLRVIQQYLFPGLGRLEPEARLFELQLVCHLFGHGNVALVEHSARQSS